MEQDRSMSGVFSTTSDTYGLSPPFTKLKDRGLTFHPLLCKIVNFQHKIVLDIVGIQQMSCLSRNSSAKSRAAPLKPVPRIFKHGGQIVVGEST